VYIKKHANAAVIKATIALLVKLLQQSAMEAKTEVKQNNAV
jgi:hypothetical protein